MNLKNDIVNLLKARKDQFDVEDDLIEKIVAKRIKQDTTFKDSLDNPIDSFTTSNKM